MPIGKIAPGSAPRPTRPAGETSAPSPAPAADGLVVYSATVTPRQADRAPGHPYFATGFQAFAHRGGIWPDTGENSLAAFTRAGEAGFTYLETDVHVTADGVLVAFHDESLERVTDGHGLIADHTAAELAGIRIGGTDRIPLLAELLQAFPRAFFNIDLKAPGAVAPLAALLKETGAQQRVCVSSFSWARISAFRRLAPEVSTGLSRMGVLLLWLGLPGLTRLLHGQAAQVPHRFWRDRIPLVTSRFVRTAHRHGIRVHVWTVNDAPTMDALLKLGVDGIVTDQPDMLREVLRQRGRWEE
ncbi:MAG: glycerophosphodiester phosphodiesterase [Propionibacteriaceae bacterium]|nr:glycerophosphodiester phosphodiesterase [Propionibacteriaceae bacterium]